MGVHERPGGGFLVAGQVILSVPGLPCLRCCSFITDERIAEEANNYGAAGGRPQVVWPNGVLASTAVGLAAQLLTPWFSEHPGFTYLEYDGNKGTVTKSVHMQTLHDRHCPHHPAEEIGDPLFDVRDFMRDMAQCEKIEAAAIHAMPHAHFITATFANGLYKTYQTAHHRYYASGQRAATFHGVGPSISWNASAALAGNPDSGEITLDWGANAAILFGRQKARTHHHTTGYYHNPKYNPPNIPSATGTGIGNRSRSIVVPNAGGFAGLSFRFADSKVSIGYRGDFFFGAMDTGFDARKSTTRGFYGPFASISVGVGD